MWKKYDLLLKWMNILVIIGSLIIVTTISIEFFRNLSSLSDELMFLQIQYWICLLFLMDYILRFIGSKHKISFFFRNIVLLIISIPFMNIILYYNIHIDHQWSIILRILPIIRGIYAIAIFVNVVTRSKISTLFVSYLTFVTSLTYFSTMIFFYIERGINPMVNVYGDAIWWAFMDLTTVGSNIYATSPLGKFLSVALAATGMMMFPIFTAYITDIFKNKHHSKDA
ncbi:MAG: ion channel [Rikenellaceae bacterium]